MSNSRDFYNVNDLKEQNNIFNSVNSMYSNLQKEKQLNNSYNKSDIGINQKNIIYQIPNYKNYYNNNLRNNNKDTLKMQIMKKDKLIFEYMEKEKELQKVISNLNQKISSINEQNLMLNEEIKQRKLNENYLQQFNILNNNQNLLKNNENNVILKLNEEKNELVNEVNRLTFIIRNHEDSIKKILNELNKKNEYINNLKNELNDKNNIMNKNEEINTNLREENKQIPSLKRKINDMEELMKLYKDQINEFKKQNEIIENNNQNLKNEINNKNKEIINEKIKEIEQNKYNNKINNLTKELENKKKENSNISEKFLTIKNDNDAFIRIIINELGNFGNFLESITIGINNEKIFQISSFDFREFPIFEKTKLNESFSLKYEIICSNIKQIKDKIINILNKGNNFWNKTNLERMALISEEKKELMNEKEELNKLQNEKNLKIKEYEILIEQLNKDYEKIKNDYLDLQQNFKEFSKKNEFLENNYINFVEQIENNLRDFPYTISKEGNNKEVSLNPFQKIIKQVSSLINFCKELNKRLKDAKKTGNEMNLNKEKEIKILYEKIKMLNNIINEKDQIINKNKLNEENLLKINKQLQNSLFSHEKNNDYNLNDNYLDIREENFCENDLEREKKLKKILDTFDFKQKINNYCKDFSNSDTINFNYTN